MWIFPAKSEGGKGQLQSRVSLLRAAPPPPGVPITVSHRSHREDFSIFGWNFPISAPHMSPGLVVGVRESSWFLEHPLRETHPLD